MESSFNFDGRRLRISLKCEDSTEEAVAKLLERFTHAEVSVDYGRSSMYTYSDRRPEGIEIVLTVPSPEPTNVP